MAVAVLIGLLLNLNRDEWFVAITFGVVIDADHLLAAPRYISDNGLGAIMRPSWDDASGLPWKSLFHEPVGAFFVVPLAIGWRYMVPFIFWGTHVAADELQMATLGQSAIIESVLLSVVVAGILYITYSRWSALSQEPSFQRFLTQSWAQARTWFSRLGASIRVP
ncbi:MAG: hypothetical protein A3K60_03860 [Euryarchaeota archaeon RBG_19FT_COMBO_56_21]|nr:MAG: hypothetical protein A3K60_03860 [Euryarchaeota archaeon RBG_19FT_COMBO_56_21]